MLLSFRFLTVAIFFALSPLLAAQKGSLDQLIDWDNPWQLTIEKFKNVVIPLAGKNGQPAYDENENKITGVIYHSLSREKHPDVEFNVFSGQIEPDGFTCDFKEGRLLRISFYLGITNRRAADPKDIKLIQEEVTKRTGAKPTNYETINTATNGSKSMTTGTEWVHENYIVRLFEVSFSMNDSFQRSGRFNLQIYLKGDGLYATTPTVDKLPELSANLDALLNFNSLWGWSADDFEKNYTPKAAKKEDQKKPPQFEWLSTDKARARFSRQMFSNVETKLSMFAGSIKVEEAVVEFVNGKAARSTISFYNRGDSGDITVADFERIFKTIGQGLGQVLKVAPKRQLNSANAALPVTGWMWTSPQAIALLEYNEYNTPGRVTKPEFLRLKLAAPSQADFTMGKMVTGVQSMELAKRVTKGTEGDIYITGVPMVDQGAKGYCVAASCQRLFEYLRIPCDQHEMAQLVNVDAESGANIFAMQKSLAKIDERFKVSFKPLVNPTLYYSNNGKRRVSEKEFTSLVKEYANKGIPLLWALELGKAVEIPPLPGSGQTGGGHMRMIIGYNDAKKQILFTDSWGAGHELKRMALLDAYDVTIGLFSMAPRGL